MRWLVACVIVAGCASAAPVPERHEARAALPQIEASSDIDGAVVGKSDARATVLVMFASWCPHCRDELAVLAQLKTSHPKLRILGINYKGHEEYNQQGDATAVRAYVSSTAPWLRVVPAEDALFTLLGSPPKIPTLYVFDRDGVLVETFDRRDRAPPDASELEELFAKLGA